MIMPVPATTGQLRTKLSDMQIGDYIACNYVASSNAVGTFSGLGTASGSEIPVSGASAPNGIFYFIKVDKGLLIADRVVQNSISWDALNLGKVIQGLPYDFGSIIPQMTSNTSPSGQAIRNNAYSSLDEAWYAFDKNTTTAWQTKTKPSWLGYTFTAPKVIKAYSIMGGDSFTPAKAPKNWTFEGSNDNFATYDVLDTRTNQTGWTNGEKRTFIINNNKPYTSYRINISDNNGDVYNYTAIVEMGMIETVGIIRSLTGGVAFADANGNRSTTDAYLGGWPQNNEWDKYIVNSNLNGKITAGDDNVWHYSPLYSWTQDTDSITGSTYRVTRGRTNANNTRGQMWSSSQSSATSTLTGFRPVLQYQE
jgi:hypothetical protein